MTIYCLAIGTEQSRGPFYTNPALALNRILAETQKGLAVTVLDGTTFKPLLHIKPATECPDCYGAGVVDGELCPTCKGAP